MSTNTQSKLTSSFQNEFCNSSVLPATPTSFQPLSTSWLLLAPCRVTHRHAQLPVYSLHSVYIRTTSTSRPFNYVSTSTPHTLLLGELHASAPAQLDLSAVKVGTVLLQVLKKDSNLNMVDTQDDQQNGPGSAP